jgi:hypothetical protein
VATALCSKPKPVTKLVIAPCLQVSKLLLLAGVTPTLPNKPLFSGLLVSPPSKPLLLTPQGFFLSQNKILD